MSKIKEIAKEVGATLTVAALTIATTGTRVFADNNAGGDTGGDTGTGGGGATAGQAGQNASTGVGNVNPGATTDLNGMIKTILNMVFGIIGIIAVIMIVIGGVNYTMSQGDSQKVQKAKNTIMYGIIGLVIVLLSFAIVNFVLAGLNGG